MLNVRRNARNKLAPASFHGRTRDISLLTIAPSPSKCGSLGRGLFTKINQNCLGLSGTVVWFGSSKESNPSEANLRRLSASQQNFQFDGATEQERPFFSLHLNMID